MYQSICTIEYKNKFLINLTLLVTLMSDNSKLSMILRRLIPYSNTQNAFAVDMLDCADEDYHFKGCVLIP